MYCTYCDKETKFETEKVKINHLLHFILSIFTFGLWILVWLILVLLVLIGADEKWTCSTCGDINRGSKKVTQ